MCVRIFKVRFCFFYYFSFVFGRGSDSWFTLLRSVVAYKRFADNVPLVIDHELVRGIERSVLSILNTGLGINGPDGLKICKDLAQESHSVANRREELTKKLDSMDIASEELLKLGIT